MAFKRQIEDKREQIENEFQLDEAKLQRLAEAVEILDAICTQELVMLEKRVAYNEAVQNLVMDKLLNSPTFGKLPSTSIIPVKRPKSGN